MIRKVLRFVIPFVVLVFIVFLFIKNENNTIKECSGFYLPEVNVFLIGKDSLLLSGEINRKPLVISFLSTDCIYCKYQALDINNNSHLYSQWNHIVLIEYHDSLSSFIKQTELDGNSDFKLTTAGNTVIDQFKISGFPATMVFSPDGEFLKEIPGELKVEKVINEIEECLK
jgi:thioredoxin-related protein